MHFSSLWSYFESFSAVHGPSTVTAHQTLKVHPSGYYAWLSEPNPARAMKEQRLLGLSKHALLGSGGVYGYRKIPNDLRELGEFCCRHRVDGLMRLEKLRS